LIFQTLDGLSGAKSHIAGKNIHQVVASNYFRDAGGVLADLAGETMCSGHSGMRANADPE
jgi:hypothetical protein